MADVMATNATNNSTGFGDNDNEVEWVSITIGEENTMLRHAVSTAIVVVAGTIDMIFSLRIIFLSRKGWKRQEDGAYCRIIAGLSLSDTLFSLSVLWTPFLVPADDVTWHWAIGNTVTCSIVGFGLTNFSITTGYYNCLLSLIFLCRVRFQWTTQQMKRLEYIGTAIVWILPLTNRIPSVVGGNINPTLLNRACTDSVYPVGCSPEDGTCERGENALFYFYVFQMQLVVAAVAGITATMLVYCHCRQPRQLKANRQYDSSESLSRERGKMLRKVAFRSTFYSLAYLNTFIWPLTSTFLAEKHAQEVFVSPVPQMPLQLFIFNCFTYFFYPSQGFFNYLIYTRHDIRELRKMYPDESYLQVFWRVFWWGESNSQHPRSSTRMTRFATAPAKKRALPPPPKEEPNNSHNSSTDHVKEDGEELSSAELEKYLSEVTYNA